MELVDKARCRQWCIENYMRVPSDHVVLFGNGEESQKNTVLIPESYGKCQVLVFALYEYFNRFDVESLVWMQEWGIWSPGLEAMGEVLWKGLRPGPESFRNYPGHVCVPDDAIDVQALLLLAMVNGWDATWIPKGGQSLIVVSHNELVTAATREAQASDVDDWWKDWTKGPETYVG